MSAKDVPLCGYRNYDGRQEIFLALKIIGLFCSRLCEMSDENPDRAVVRLLASSVRLPLPLDIHANGVRR
jgi:hypothetical protein